MNIPKRSVRHQLDRKNITHITNCRGHFIPTGADRIDVRIDSSRIGVAIQIHS